MSAAVKGYAREIGFQLVGIASPEPFERAELDIVRWLQDGHQGEMAWLNAARTRLATRPRELLPEARSLIVLGVSYRTDDPPPPDPVAGRVARYAWGRDYHDVLKARLKLLSDFLSQQVGRPARCRGFVDSGPLVERDAAVRAGLGFRGKNTNLLTPIGSYVFLSALLTDVELDFDTPQPRDCGSCRLCLEACPTGALDEAYHLAAERCIAYLTIEHRGPIDAELRPRMGSWVFGCDICQEVCPYNASPRAPRGWPEFQPQPGAGSQLDLPELLATDEAGFRERFRGSPIKRAKRRGLLRNAAIALGNSGAPAAREALQRCLQNETEPVVRDAADWALSRVPD